MLYQLHWQFKDGTTEIMAQGSPSDPKEMQEWVRETTKEHPLPEGAKWLMCNEKSKHFVWTAEEHR